jgi:CRP/FNR family transcriptional regulator, cyclic AMP receptor protein
LRKKRQNKGPLQDTTLPQPQDTVYLPPIATPAAIPSAFTGLPGKKRVLEALKSQTLVSGSTQIAKALQRYGNLEYFQAGQELMVQGNPDNDIFLIVSGQVSIHINGREVAKRATGTHIGEMALVEPLARRSATVRAVEPTVVMRVTEHHFTSVARNHSDLWRRVAIEIARRLRERSQFLRMPHSQPVCFIGSSTEGLKIAEHLHDYLVKKAVIPRLWSNGVFQASSTTIESLVAQAMESDFAALVLTADDITVSRGSKKASPRDNVIFELGLFMGAIGRERVFILKPKGLDVRIPSDLLGVVWLEYLRGGPKPKSKRLRPLCNGLISTISKLGPR